MKNFEGKTAVVTGAASGIGFGLAEKFAQAEDAGSFSRCRRRGFR